jgi:peptidoglycan hydrolase-like protein with peptidoglycan-binding domain
MPTKKVRILSVAIAGGLVFTGVTAAVVTPGHTPAPAALAANTASSSAVNLDDCPTLSEGYQDVGCVSQLQTELNTDNGTTTPVDGVFGPQTKAAVITFQQNHHIVPADGIVGPQTKAALGNLGSSSAGTPPGQLNPGQQITSGTQVASPDGKFVLQMQSDGNLVLRAPGNIPLGDTHTAGHDGTIAVMQADGNFVLIAPGNIPVWASGTDGHPGTVLQVQDDGAVVLYAPGHQVLRVLFPAVPGPPNSGPTPTIPSATPSTSAPSASAPTADRYIALGDSFSAGEGNSPFDPGTNVREPGTQPYDLCHRSSAAYPKLLNNKYGWSLDPLGFVACSGAEVDNIVDGFPEQHEGTQLNKLDDRTTAVTISVGGNDMEFSNILKHCIWGPGAPGVQDCAHQNFEGQSPDVRAATLKQELTQDMTCNPQLINNEWHEGDRCDVSLDVTNGEKTGTHVAPSLHELYKMIENAAPYAHLYVLLYPHLFANVSNKNISNNNVCDVVSGVMSGTFNPENPFSWNIDASDMKWLNSQVDLVDDTISSEAKVAGGQISIVDPRPLWNGTSGSGHGLCGIGSTWLNGLILATNKWGAGPDQESFHPNVSGQEAFAESFPIRTRPSAPQNLTVSVNGNTAQISWQPPANGGQAAFVGYELDWDTGTADAVQHLSAGQTTFTLTGLSPGTHAISVFAINTVGTGPAATNSAVIGAGSGGSR